LTIKAKAKINLGLEVLGKREDGFHEIRSILAMVELADTITFRTSNETIGSVSVHPSGSHIEGPGNLVEQAISAFNEVTGLRIVPDIKLLKHIPIAAGLGGASADCAATLLALNELAAHPLCNETLSEIAASLGSDVPFFLGSPSAMATGRGTETRPVRMPTGAVLIISPRIRIANKTRTLYAALLPGEFSSGVMVDQQAQHLNATGEINRECLDNAFDAALVRISEHARSIANGLTACGLSRHWLSGAGPSRYALFDDTDECDRMAILLRERLGGTARVIATRFATHGLQVSP
jgi:4-diphosphocytidyl-2-C-methyl-D-erythritol kinase